MKAVTLFRWSSEPTLTRTSMWRWAIDRQGVRLAQRPTRQRVRVGMGSWSGGPGAWDRFTPSASRAQDPMAPDSPGSWPAEAMLYRGQSA